MRYFVVDKQGRVKRQRFFEAKPSSNTLFVKRSAKEGWEAVRKVVRGEIPAHEIPRLMSGDEYDLCLRLKFPVSTAPVKAVDWAEMQDEEASAWSANSGTN